MIRGLLFTLAALAISDTAEAKQEVLVCKFQGVKEHVLLEGGKNKLEKSGHFHVIEGPKVFRKLNFRGKVEERKINIGTTVFTLMLNPYDGSIVSGPAQMYMQSHKGSVHIFYVAHDPTYLVLQPNLRGHCEIAVYY